MEQLPLLHERVARPVRLAPELQEAAVVDRAVELRGGHLVVAEDLPPAGEPQARGDRGRLSPVGLRGRPEQRPCAVRVERQEAGLVHDSMRARPTRESPRSSLPSSRARLRRITSDEAVKNRALALDSHASAHSAPAMCVLPQPTPPMRMRPSLPSRKGSDSRPIHR